MNILNLKQNKKLLTLAIISAFFVVLNMYLTKHWLVSSSFFIIYFSVVSFALGNKITIAPRWQRFFWGALCLLSIFIILGTTIYYAFATTKFTSLFILLLPLFIFFFKDKVQKEYNLKKEKKNGRYLPFAMLLFDFGLLATLFANRTTDLLRSPWHALEPTFFLVFAIATGLLFYIIFKNKNNAVRFGLSCLHLFITFSIAAILYKLGFGFDAFVHRATEQWISANGFILPKTPYYIGQYSFVVWLKHVTNIPIFYLDVYLVPVLASVTLPGAISLTLKKIWNIPFKFGLLLVWLIPFIPFLTSYLNLTTPFNLAFLFGIITVFTTFAFLKEKLNLIIPISAALVALAVHPLVGTPIFIFTLSSFFIKKFQQNKKIKDLILIGNALILLFLMPTLFIIRNLSLNLNLNFPSFTNPFLQIPNFISLFQRPYWYAKTSPIIFELLYTWAWFIVPVVVALAIAGIISRHPERSGAELKDPVTSITLFLTTVTSIFLSAFLLRSLVVFPDVAAYEQGDFPLRLVKLSLIFLLPFAMLGFYKLLTKLQSKYSIFYILSSIFTIIITLSLYLGYPQHNPKARFPGLNITQSDYNATQWIHDQNEQYDYVVLANQLVSAAALTKYSFAKYFQTDSGEIFYYSVPTGGLLYKQYGQMLYEGQKREFMETAMDIAGVDKSYFVLNSYWANSDKIIEGAKKTADSWQIIDEGKIWIFEYSKNN